MLISLCIDQFAIVSHLEIDFKTGMTAFTGETGAGKSIIIDALMLVLGGRADASVIRPGSAKCDISAIFILDENSAPAIWLQNHDLACENGELILRRVITAQGRSKSYINGEPFPLQKAKELGLMLVDIHGQHQHQSLLEHKTHRQQLDQFANHVELLNKVQTLYKECEAIENKLKAKQETNNERLELLNFQIEELLNLNLQEGEVEKLNEEHHFLHNACSYLEQSKQILELISDDETPNICKQLNQILQILSSMPKNNQYLDAISELISNALIQTKEAEDEIKNFADKIQLDPERLFEVEARIGILHQTARKYHVEASQLLIHLTKLQDELHVMQQNIIDAESLKEQYETLNSEYEKCALKLRESRTKHATKLAAEISETIRTLGMPKGYIEIEITPLTTKHKHGQDKVEYKVCTNPGMLPDTLSKIASGGELSRISLAIHMITAQRGATPTLIFDEVDVGIGGATAALVGQLLRKLGNRLQILCVTHQAQVAASANHHVLVIKNTHETQTFATIVPLENKEKIDEIARMLGGLTITSKTKLHARELLEEMH